MARIKYKEAVGLEVKKGKPAIGMKPNKEELEKLYIKKSKSIREIADILGCSKDMIHRALLEHRIKIVSKEGYRGGARILGVGYTTLRTYLKRREQ